MPTHEAIAAALTEMDPRGIAQGFSLNQWLRVGLAAWYGNLTREWNDFRRTLKQLHVFELPWSRGDIDHYPAHGILRRRMLIGAVSGAVDEVEAALQALAALHPLDRQQLVLAVVQAAAYVETACHFDAPKSHPAKALLDGSRRSPGARHLLEQIDAVCKGRFPSIRRIVGDWQRSIDQWRADGAQQNLERERLLAATRAIPY